MAVWLPAWSTDRRRRRERRDPDPRPLVLAARERQRTVVARCCPEASAAGVRTGMPPAQARALFPVDGLRDEPHEPAADRAALERLAAWAHRFAPIVAIDDTDEEAEPDGLLLDVSGCARAWGGERAGLEAVTGALSGLGFGVRAAIAPTYAAARAVARFGTSFGTGYGTGFGKAGFSPGRGVILAPADVRGAVAPLPIEALAVPGATVRTLAEVGIRRIGDLLELPRRTIPARFGDGLLCRLDRVLGQGIETIDRLRPEAPFEARCDFDGPTDRTEAIEEAVHALLGELAGDFVRRGRGARRLEVELVRSDLAPETLSVVLGRPRRDPAHLWGLVRPKLERAHLGFGVEGVRVRAPATGPVRPEQIECGIETGGRARAIDGAACGELLDTLRNRLGDRRVRRPALRASHLPERAFALVDPDGGEGPAGMAGLPDRSLDRSLGRLLDRPTVLLGRPEEARVIALTPDGPVHRVAWRGADLGVVACAGPERIAGEWWRSRAGARTRDYFAVRLEDGRRLWLARSLERGSWFVHGVWA